MRDIYFRIGTQESYDSLQDKNDKVFYRTSDEKNLYLGDQQLNNKPMEGATKEKSGKSGAVPAPTKEERNKFLKGDGTWGSPTIDQADITSVTGLHDEDTGEPLESGNNNTPVYFHEGKPTPIGYSINKTVPEDAQFTDTTYSAATDTEAGLMSAADKTKLDSIEEPGDGEIILTQSGQQKGSFTLNQDTGAFIDLSYEAATTESEGLMSAEDKSKLDNIEAGAQVNVDPGNATITITQKGVSKGSFTVNQDEDVTIELSDEDTSYGLATEEQDGLMSKEDKTKLNAAKITAFTGATNSENGTLGLVPQPISADKDKYLKGDGSWGDPNLYWKSISESGSNVGKSLAKVASRFITLPRDYHLFGFSVENDSSPDSIIRYIGDNESFSSAYMDFDNDEFNCGDWTIENGAWFMNPRYCMLKYDGTVAYYLDSSKADISNENFPGNVMVEIPKIYYKVSSNEIYFCDQKLDDQFVCWSHINGNDEEINYCYMPAYEGSLIDGRLRSLSGKIPSSNLTAKQETDYAKANNIGNSNIWNKEVYADRILIDLLLLLIGKSTDTQSVFGKGNVEGGQENVKITGSMNDRGLFYGSRDGTQGAKVFGMEHYWGNLQRRVAGWINAKGIQKVKLTSGQLDGSTADDYNMGGSGYIAIPNSNLTDSGYISKYLYTNKGILPIEINGSSSTYYTDNLSFCSTGENYALVGGDVNSGLSAGAFCTDLNNSPFVAKWYINSSISCKP